MADRHDLAAERAVLAACLLDADAAIMAGARLRAADFYHPAHAVVFDAMLALGGHGGAIDVVTLGAELVRRNALNGVGGHAFLASLTDDIPVVAHFEKHLALVADAARVRALAGAARQVLGRAEDLAVDGPALAAFAGEVMRDAGEGHATDTVATLDDLLRRNFEEIEAGAGKSATGLTTGLRGWDTMTDGLHADELIVVAARPGVGKTALAGNVMRAAAAVGPVLMFSLEMRHVAVSQRLLCGEARVDQMRVRRRTVTQDEWNRLLVAAQALTPLPITIDDRAGQPLGALRMKALAHQRRHGLVLVVVDYLQLVKVPGAESRQLEIAEVARGLKELAKEIKCPVLALAQLNRGVESRGPEGKPRLSDLRESGEIEQAADVVAFISRDMRPDLTPEERSRAELIVAKQRNGPTDVVPLRFDREFTLFSDPPADTSPGPDWHDADEHAA